MIWYAEKEYGDDEFKSPPKSLLGIYSKIYTEIHIYLGPVKKEFDYIDVIMTKEGYLSDATGDIDDFSAEVPRKELKKIIKKNLDCEEYLFNPITKTLKPMLTKGDLKCKK